MALYICRNWSDWVLAPEGGMSTSPGSAFGFDTDTGRPCWRVPGQNIWVDGTGDVVLPAATGFAQFYSKSNSGLLAAVL